MKKKVRVRQRVSKVRVLRNEKTLPQRKMYTPRVKLCGCTWVFTIGDPDDKPSVPHAHAVDSGYRLDAWTGDIYPAGTERMQKIGKLKEKELHRLHSDSKFLAHAKKQIDWYREKYPATHFYVPDWFALSSLKMQLNTHNNEQAKANQRIQDAAQTLENASPHITEWDESAVRQLVETVKVLSKDEIAITLKGGIEICQKIMY